MTSLELLAEILQLYSMMKTKRLPFMFLSERIVYDVMHYQTAVEAKA